MLQWLSLWVLIVMTVDSMVNGNLVLVTVARTVGVI